MEGVGIEPQDGVVIDPVQLPGGGEHEPDGGFDFNGHHDANGEHEPDGGFDFNGHHDANGDHEPDDDFFDVRGVVCALCDDGGHLLCCEGPCLRLFHPTREDGRYSGCISLGFTSAQLKAMDHFFCINCTNREHHCARCGVLGSSAAADPQVFLCSDAACGRFYHPACISAELHPGDPGEAARCRDRVAAGLAFQCPLLRN